MATRALQGERAEVYRHVAEVLRPGLDYDFTHDTIYQDLTEKPGGKVSIVNLSNAVAADLVRPNRWRARQDIGLQVGHRGAVLRTANRTYRWFEDAEWLHDESLYVPSGVTPTLADLNSRVVFAAESGAPHPTAGRLAPEPAPEPEPAPTPARTVDYSVVSREGDVFVIRNGTELYTARVTSTVEI